MTLVVIVIKREKESDYLATVEMFPEAKGWGPTPEKAFDEAIESANSMGIRGGDDDFHMEQKF